MVKNKRSFGLLTVLAPVAALLPAGAAQAHSLVTQDCIVTTPLGSCTSGVVAAGSNHLVFVRIQTGNGGCAYRIINADSGAPVLLGNVPARQVTNQTLVNAAGRYRLGMTCADSGWGSIRGA
ncbi:hypothetical protein BJY16_005231 [Actinoplanes octamycinicus]|uniref:Secreted protein n=1 Tax=Actinoplanes octamycinicus TaxID=135948 RepID=A0A7W7H107_9ACTN|nr:hypothetical protein [Actinoplanes octamycinicus]MBB4741772.1 hypothetical protein [Actinoplanes octamycinicus]GIE57329.1 hypothetical protein Aoc01nite_27310 [Actinoplanes octamycinicus]